MSYSRLFEIIMTLCILVIAIIFYQETANIAPPEYDILEPAAVPKAVSIIIMILSALHLAMLILQEQHLEHSHTVSSDTTTDDNSTENVTSCRHNYKALFGFLLLTGMYILFFQYEWVHFIVMTFIFSNLSILLLGEWNKRTMVLSLIISGILSLGLYLMFTNMFVIRLPGVY